MKKRLIALLLVITVLVSLAACGTKDISTKSDSADDYSTELFGDDVITVEITADEDDWDSLMENATSKPTISADVTINGETYDDVAIKTKGNTSLQQVASSDSERFSLSLNFGKNVDDQTCDGLDKLVLNNIYGDSTYLKEYMSYSLFQYMDVPSSLCSFAEVTVNGEHYGFYLAVEDVDDSFLERNYGDVFSGEAYKPESMDMDGMQGNPEQGKKSDRTAEKSNTATSETLQNDSKAKMGNPPEGGGQMSGGSQGVDLVYADDSADSYSNIFDNEITKTDDEDEERLIASLKAISEGDDLEEYINIDEVLRYAAVNVFLVNLDSYFSNMGHNYCLVEDDGQLSMIPWDYNLSFGTYQISSASDAVNYAIDTVFYNVDAEERPIISKLLENEEYQEKYHEYLQELCDYVTSGAFEEKIDSISTAIDSYVQNDTTSFDGYDAYVSGVEALKIFVTLRAESVEGQLDGTIPSTTDGQKNSDALVDCGDLNLNALGGMGNGGGQMNGDGPPQGDKQSKTYITDNLKRIDKI